MKWLSNQPSENRHCLTFGCVPLVTEHMMFHRLCEFIVCALCCQQLESPNTTAWLKKMSWNKQVDLSWSCHQWFFFKSRFIYVYLCRNMQSYGWIRRFQPRRGGCFVGAWIILSNKTTKLLQGSTEEGIPNDWGKMCHFYKLSFVKEFWPLLCL